MRYAIPIGIFAILVIFFFIGLGLHPSRVPSPLIGKPAPAFELTNLADESRTVGTDDFSGEVALLNVWATWCVGCRQEHDALLEIAESGIVPIYGLNWKDDRRMALRWLTQLGDPYTATAFDADGRVAIDWGVYGAPETFLIAADGTVLYKHISPLTMDTWRDEILPLVLEAKGRAQ